MYESLQVHVSLNTWFHHNNQQTSFIPLYSIPIALPSPIVSRVICPFSLPFTLNPSLSPLLFLSPSPSITQIYTSSVPFPPLKHTVGPIFFVNEPTTREGEQLVVRLSAPILTQSFVPPFNGRIEVNITAEDLPAGDTHLRATLGMSFRTCNKTHMCS